MASEMRQEYVLRVGEDEQKVPEKGAVTIS